MNKFLFIRYLLFLNANYSHGQNQFFKRQLLPDFVFFNMAGHEFPMFKKIFIRKRNILFLSFRRVLNVNYSFLGNSPASEF